MSAEFAWMSKVEEILQPQLAEMPEAREWLAETRAALQQSDEGFASAFAEASRRVGRGVLAKRKLAQPVHELPHLEVAGWRMPLYPWRRSDAARALLAAADAQRDPAGALKRLASLYWHGDSDERTSVLRLLGLMPGGAPEAPLPVPPVEAGYEPEEQDDGPTHALRVVLDSFRTNIAPLFDAATANNPFFSRATPELEFNKAVLKRVFVDLPLEEVLGLRGRANAELSRMLLNLAEEREVTLRPYPVEVWPVVAGHPVPGFAAKMIGLIEHPDDQLRRAAAEALGIMREPKARSFLEERLRRETQTPVKQALEAALAALEA